MLSYHHFCESFSPLRPFPSAGPTSSHTPQYYSLELLINETKMLYESLFIAGIYRRQADQKWSQKWIWWVFHFLHFLTFCDQLSLHTFSIYLPSADQSEHISRCAWHICRWKNLNISKRIQKFWDIITFVSHFRLCVRFRRPVQLAHIRPSITL